MAFPTRDNTYTQEEVNILESNIDLYTTSEVDDLVGGIEGGGGIDCYGLLGANTVYGVSTSGENLYIGSLMNSDGVSRSPDLGYYAFYLTDDEDVEYIEVSFRFNINRTSADGDAVGASTLMYNIGYSDDSGSSWSEDNERSGILRVDGSTQYCTHIGNMMFPHTSGRYYRVRLDTGGNITIQDYDSDQSTITDPDGDSYNVRRYGVWMRVKGY